MQDVYINNNTIPFYRNSKPVEVILHSGQRITLNHPQLSKFLQPQVKGWRTL